MLNPLLFLKLAPLATLLWFFKSQIPSLIMAAFRWLMGHKKISVGAVVVLVLLLGGTVNYLYIQHLKSEITEREEIIDNKNDYINTLIFDIMMQNEAISEMKKTQDRLSKEARTRLDAELERQEIKLEQIENVEELNQWLDTLRF